MDKEITIFYKFCDEINACINSGGVSPIDVRKKHNIETSLKALTIIKNKKVNVIILCGCDNLEEYNKHPLSYYKLTKEEWDILKYILTR